MSEFENKISKEWIDILSINDDLTDSYINKSWQRDQYLMMAIETGNKEMLHKIREFLPSYGIGEHYYGNPVIEGNRLRERKNGLIIRNTLCRVGAGRGGVPPRYIHNISEKYILLIERQTSPQVLLNTIGPIMIEEYIDLVNHFSVSQYSGLIKKVVIYISENIQGTLSLSNIAEKFHINPSHLSREFKKETGYNLTEYINKQKIDLAKLFLVQNNYTVMQVSDLLNYNSSSYFSKTFKKIAGVSPTDYINNYHEDKKQ